MHDQPIPQEIGSVDGRVSCRVVKHPGEVGVEETTQSAQLPTSAGKDRAMDVSGLVMISVMAAMVGNPAEDCTLPRETCAEGEPRQHAVAALEASMRKETMQAKRKAETRPQVEDGEDKRRPPTDPNATDRDDRVDSA